jgi:hypothetical protein
VLKLLVAQQESQNTQFLDLVAGVAGVADVVVVVVLVVSSYSVLHNNTLQQTLQEYS